MNVWALMLLPQETTVPSLFRARLWLAPAEIATTPDSPGGTLLLWNTRLSPQPTTVPSLLRARQKSNPAEMAMTPETLAGTSASPNVSSPQTATVPSPFSARL